MSESKLISFMLDPSSDAKTLGEPYLQNEAQDRMFCPKCLEEIYADPGYGLAFGGMGVYWICEADGCGWFYKIMDRDEDDDSGESDGSEVPAQVPTHGMPELNRSEAQDCEVLRPGVQAEGSPRDAQKR